MSAHALIESLHGLRRRVKAFAVAYGVALVVALAVGILLAILLIDYELSLDPSGRLMLMLIGLGAWGYAAWHCVVRPVRAKVTISHIAGSLEHTYPQFDDRLRSTVDFVGHDVPGSETMKERVVDQATELARGVNLDQVIVGRPVYLSIAGAVAALVLLIVLTGIARHEGVLDIALNRLALGSDSWPKTVTIAMTSKLPPRVYAGQHVDVAVRLTKGDRESRKTLLEYRYGDGPWQQQVMARGADGVYTAALDARLPADEKSANLQTRITSGDDQITNSMVVVPKLEIADVQAGVMPPSYVLPQHESTVDLTQRPAIAVEGSNVTLHFTFNKNLLPVVSPNAPIELRSVKDPSGAEGDKPAPLPVIHWDYDAAAGTAIAHFQADKSFRFNVHATDTDHFNNVGSEEYQVIVREDQLPTVQIEEPRHSDEYTPNAKFAIRAVADDDFGVAAARLVVNRITDQNGQTTDRSKNSWTVDLVKNSLAVGANIDWQQVDSTSDRRRYTLGYDWDLASALVDAKTQQPVTLKPGDVLEYCVQVKDNFSLNGTDHDWVSSGKLRASIVSLDQIKTEATQVLQQLAGNIDATKKAQDLNQLDTKTLQQTLDQRKKFNEPDQAQADRLANQQNNLAVQTQQISDKLSALDKKLDINQLPEQDPLRVAAKSGSQALQDVVNSPMHQAKQSLNDAKDAPPPDAKASPDQKAQDATLRSSKLDASAKQQTQASADLDAAKKKLGDFDTLDAMANTISKIEKAQADLNKEYPKKLGDVVGQKPEDMTPEKKKDQTDLTQKQNELKKQTESAMQSMAKQGNQQNPADPEAAEAMKAAQAQGQQDNVTGQQGESSDSMQKNQQNNAQQAQQQADLGLKHMEDILKKEQLAKLEKLKAKLDKLAQEIQELAKRQAGHNMDNLLLQGGPAQLQKLSAVDATQLFELSVRQATDLPTMHPELGVLTKSQEQTELNARALLKDTDDLKDPTASAKIEAAAGQMERAAVELQNNKLADAYDPPQVEALRDLLTAKAAIDKAAADAQKKLDQHKKDTIRQQYEALLKDQQDLDAHTRDIDKLPKNDDGTLSRAAIGQTRPLPNIQQALADRAGQIGEALKGLGSTVYSWANDDIISSMGDVKDDLTKPDTGTATQAEQQRIEDQLAAMIEELKEVPPPKKEFEEKKNGGGGGGGGNGKKKPSMPTDAELRLLRDLQLAINKNTDVLNKLPTPDDRRLTALGHREGSVRGLFDQIIQKATKGAVKLNPPPNDNLPDNATDKDIENQELDAGLLGDNANNDSVTAGIMLTGDRMARVDQRLAANKDSGKVTQDIEKRIVVGITDMIKLAQQQQQQQQQSGPPKPGEQPKPGSGDKDGPQKPGGDGSKAGPHQESGSSAAKDSSLSDGGPPNVDNSAMVQNNPDKWGAIPPRNRQALTETATEKPIGRWSDQVSEYYKTLSQAASKAENH